MAFVLGPRSLKVLQSVHTDLQKVVNLAITISTVDFAVIQGLRTREQELALWLTCHNKDGTPNGQPWKTSANGTPVGQTNPEGIAGTGLSNHQSGQAVDMVALYDGIITWNLPPYLLIDNAMQEAAVKLGIPITYGGGFPKPDSDHWELSKAFYS